MSPTTPERLQVASRIVAAVFGGYVFANVAGILISRLLPMPRAEAVLSAVLASFALYAAAIVWAFAARSARLAWFGLLTPMVFCGALAWLLGGPA